MRNSVSWNKICVVELGILKKTAKDCSYAPTEDYNIEFVSDNTLSISDKEGMSFASCHVSCDCIGTGVCHLNGLSCTDLCWGNCHLSVVFYTTVKELFNL